MDMLLWVLEPAGLTNQRRGWNLQVSWKTSCVDPPTTFFFFSDLFHRSIDLFCLCCFPTEFILEFRVCLTYRISYNGWFFFHTDSTCCSPKMHPVIWGFNQGSLSWDMGRYRRSICWKKQSNTVYPDNHCHNSLLPWKKNLCFWQSYPNGSGYMVMGKKTPKIPFCSYQHGWHSWMFMPRDSFQQGIATAWLPFLALNQVSLWVSARFSWCWPAFDPAFLRRCQNF